MNPLEHMPRLDDPIVTRRDFLRRTGMGVGALSLATLLGPEFLASSAYGAQDSLNPLAPKAPPLPAKAKHVIHIFAEGAPSHVDTFDPKPELVKWAGKELPGLRGSAFPSPFKFNKCGKSGLEISEIFPKLSEHADEMAVIRSMYTDIPAHEVAQIFMNTGSLRLPRPSLGSWVTYGLGSENQNMPGFVVLRQGGSKSSMTASCQSAFLPGVFQGTMVSTAKIRPDEILENIHNQFMGLSDQREQLDFVRKLNEIHAAKMEKDAQLEARLQAFEMAYKMQTEASDAFDISKEPLAVREMYGATGQGNQLLIARRLVERGVRFVQVWAGGWDTHADIEGNLPKRAGEIDGPVAALIADLKQRGLLESTLIIWGGEFGRTVTYDRNGNDKPGRDHNNKAFCTWMAGGGVKGGMAYGATDEFGSKSVENKVHVHDLHATILALLGFDHTKLTYRVNGRDFRLTDVSGNVVRDIIA